MKTLTHLIVASLLFATTTSVVAPGEATAGQRVSGSSTIPRWVRHVQRFTGGISNGVRASVDPSVVNARTRIGNFAGRDNSWRIMAGGSNVQMNADSSPPLPQNETSVAVNPNSPDIAVAAANDYVGAGFVIMRTIDGGSTWSTSFQAPAYSGTREPCFGADPWVDYSLRDHAFLISTLCYFGSSPVSEVHVWKSTDDGESWTPPGRAAIVASNVDAETGRTDRSIFLDKEQLVVDNNPDSPHFGRVYVTYVKFHMLASGFSDYCPVQVAYTDSIPSNGPQKSIWEHTAVVPDAPGDDGIGPSANQWAQPQVERDGTLDIAYVLEDCNNGIDRRLNLQRSTNGGRSFRTRPVRIDGPGQFVDNPRKSDRLGETAFNASISPSFHYNQADGSLTYVYQNNLDHETSGANISFQISADGGETWSSNAYISINPDGTPAANDQFFPAITSDPSGTLYAIFFDRRLDPANHDIDTFEAVSSDGGETWTNIRISSASWNPDESFFRCGCFIGDYNAIAASSSAIYPVWTDGRSSGYQQTGIGETDIFTDVEKL